MGARAKAEHSGSPWTWVVVMAMSASSCIIDSDRCDKHQVQLHDDGYSLCVCEANAVVSASGVGCTPCGIHEEVQSNACTCEPGFARSSSAASCTESQIGADCSGGLPCPSAFPYCVPTSVPYCSLANCSVNADCPAGFTCESSAAMRYCQKPRTGLGLPCTSDQDCASFEANYCETLASHTCILQGCASGSVVCPNMWACCDYSALFGSAFSTCVTPETLVAGACPQNGQLVVR